MEKSPAPRYIVLEKSLIGNRLHEAGEEVEYDGLPAENLQPTCDAGRAKAAEYKRSNEERVARMARAYPAGADADAFHKAVQAAIAESNAAHATQQAALVAQLQAMQQAQPALIAAAIAEALKTIAPAGKAGKAGKDAAAELA